MVVGHSLGSVVAYEVLCALRPERPPLTLVTLGSPLGLAGLVFDRLQPAPQQDGTGIWPAPVKHWTNVADSGDMVALVRELAPRFGPEVLDLLVDNGSATYGSTSEGRTPGKQSIRDPYGGVGAGPRWKPRGMGRC